MQAAVDLAGKFTLPSPISTFEAKVPRGQSNVLFGDQSGGCLVHEKAVSLQTLPLSAGLGCGP